MINKKNYEMNTEYLVIEKIIEFIYDCSGYDFRNYSRASITRRIKLAGIRLGCEDIEEFAHLILSNKKIYKNFVNQLTVNFSEMFRDPIVFNLIREVIIPYLGSFPEIKIWCAGCSRGEEVYSMAILLEEAGLLERSRIYGTDINSECLDEAKCARMSLDAIKLSTRNYFKMYGLNPFSDYFIAYEERAFFSKKIQERILFTEHNLVSDHAFGEMQFILCRNVMIYFDSKLKKRVMSLLLNSLTPKGYLCLGTSETLNSQDDLEEVREGFGLYRKIFK